MQNAKCKMQMQKYTINQTRDKWSRVSVLATVLVESNVEVWLGAIAIRSVSSIMVGAGVLVVVMVVS